VGLRKASQSSDEFLLEYFLNGALTLSRPAHGQFALTYACGIDALISHYLHFVQAPLNTCIKKASHFCEAL
jgi:hypothetical protein